MAASSETLYVGPPIPARSILQLLGKAEETLDGVLDKLYELDEGTLADHIQKGLNTAARFLDQVVNEIPASDDAVAARYKELCSKHGESAGIVLHTPTGDGQVVEHTIGPREVANGIGFVRNMLREVSEELLSFSRDDVEDISDATLACSRIWVEIGGHWLHKVVRQFETEHKAEAEEEKERRARGPQVEEATEDEIEALYRSRGETPPSRTGKGASGSKSPRVAHAASPSHHSAASRSARARARRGPPQRVLWKPLQPQLMSLATNLPDTFSKAPVQTAGTVAVLLPFTGVVVFCLPGLLLTDHLLQKVYEAYGPNIEVAVDDGKQMAKLAWTVSRLSVRQSYRVVKRQAQKMIADPKAAAETVANAAAYAAAHPMETATEALEVARTASVKAVNMVKWLYGVVHPSEETAVE